MVHVVSEPALFNYSLPKCPLCGRNNSLTDSGLFYVEASIVHPSRLKYYDATDEKELVYMACRCGLFYMARYITPPRIDRLYRMGEYRQSMNDEKSGPAIEKDDRDHANKIAPLIFENIASIKSVMDVGCSTGTLLKQVAQHYRARMMGVEPNAEQRQGLSMPNVGDLSELQKGDKYDLVIISHVLEHVINPVEMLEKIKEHIAPGGYLFVQVPIMMPGLPHPLMFTEAAIILLLVKTGYRIEFTDNKYHYSAIAKPN